MPSPTRHPPSRALRSANAQAGLTNLYQLIHWRWLALAEAGLTIAVAHYGLACPCRCRKCPLYASPGAYNAVSSAALAHWRGVRNVELFLAPLVDGCSRRSSPLSGGTSNPRLYLPQIAVAP